MNKAVNKLMFPFSVKNFILVAIVTFLTSVIGLVSCGVMLSSIELGEESYLGGDIIITTCMNALLQGAIIVCGSSNFVINYSAMRVMPVKKEKGIKSSFLNIDLLISAIHIGELLSLLLVLLLFTELNFINVLSAVIVLVGHIGLLVFIYNMVVYSSMKVKKQPQSMMCLFLFLFVLLGIGAAKGAMYSLVISSSPVTALISSVAFAAAAVILAAVTANTVAKSFD